MAASSKVRIMISSRCRDDFPLNSGRSLSAIREEIKGKIEEARVFDQQIYDVWINETAIEDGERPAWEKCLMQAKDCDIFIALYNGNAGWPGSDGAIGICHAELQTAYSKAPGKVYIVNIYEAKPLIAPKDEPDLRFQRYVNDLAAFDSRNIKTEKALIEKVCLTVAKATVQMAQRGVREASKGTCYEGPALDWTRLNYSRRAQVMRETLLDSFNSAQIREPEKNHILKSIEKKEILFVISAVPDAMSVAAARESVGRPHLDDYKIHDALANVYGGPVHLIACHKGVTEAQARAILGFPDSTVVTAPFGVYVVDPVQRIQIVLLSQCRDETNTQLRAQDFFKWLNATNQAAELVKHAHRRKIIVKALAGK
jgi:hypothetical protein